MYKTITLIGLSAIALASCTSNITSNQVENIINLDSTKWENSISQLDFQDGRYSANAGCNSISGEYNISENGKITLENGVSTMMLCDEETMKNEQNLQSFLTKVNSFEYSDDTLVLQSQTDSIEFSAAQMASLTDTKWKLNGMLVNDGVVNDVAFENAFVEFTQDGKISGNAMCNSFLGEFTQSENSLEIWALASTKKMCPAEVNSYETQILADLQNVSKYEISRNSLTLSNSDDSVRLNFTAE